MEMFGAERWFWVRARNRCPPVEKNWIPRSRLDSRDILVPYAAYLSTYTHFNVWLAYAYTYLCISREGKCIDTRRIALPWDVHSYIHRCYAASLLIGRNTARCSGSSRNLSSLEENRP